MFTTLVMPKFKMNLREATNVVNQKHFKMVKSTEAALEDAQKLKDLKVASITQEDLEECLKETIVQRVTPLAHLPYPEQLK